MDTDIVRNSILDVRGFSTISNLAALLTFRERSTCLYTGLAGRRTKTNVLASVFRVHALQSFMGMTAEPILLF